MYNVNEELLLWDKYTSIIVIVFAVIRTTIYSRHYISDCFAKTNIFIDIISWVFCIILFLFIFFFIISPIYNTINQYLYKLHDMIGSIASLVFLSISLEIAFRMTVFIIKFIHRIT